MTKFLLPVFTIFHLMSVSAIAMDEPSPDDMPSMTTRKLDSPEKDASKRTSQISFFCSDFEGTQKIKTFTEGCGLTSTLDISISKGAGEFTGMSPSQFHTIELNVAMDENTFFNLTDISSTVVKGKALKSGSRLKFAGMRGVLEDTLVEPKASIEAPEATYLRGNRMMFEKDSQLITNAAEIFLRDGNFGGSISCSSYNEKREIVVFDVMLLKGFKITAPGSRINLNDNSLKKSNISLEDLSDALCQVGSINGFSVEKFFDTYANNKNN